MNAPERNIKLEIEFNGANYCGWQQQNKHQGNRVSGHQKKSIQETIEGALRKILREEIKLIGSSRTDAGVHAKAFVANFKTKSGLSLSKLRLGINALLPTDIVVVGTEEVDAGFNSRFSAKSKIYRYTILNRTFRSVFYKDYAYLFPHRLNVRLMQQEAKTLLGRNNFKAFQTSDYQEKNSVRTIKKIAVKKKGGFIYIDVEADGFLYNMMRSITGTLIEIGKGRIPKGNLKIILCSRDRSLAGPKVPAKALCLMKVEY